MPRTYIDERWQPNSLLTNLDRFIAKKERLKSAIIDLLKNDLHKNSVNMGRADQGLNQGVRYQAVLRVLVFLRNESDVLLIKGASNKRIWPNLFNGVGGHVETREDVMSAAKREVQEETGLLIDPLDLRAVVNIDAGDRNRGIMMFAFVGWTNNRQTVASPEGALQWISIDKICEYPLVEDLYWLIPRIIERKSGQPPLYLHYDYDQADRLVIEKSD